MSIHVFAHIIESIYCGFLLARETSQHQILIFQNSNTVTRLIKKYTKLLSLGSGKLYDAIGREQQVPGLLHNLTKGN